MNTLTLLLSNDDVHNISYIQSITVYSGFLARPTKDFYLHMLHIHFLANRAGCIFLKSRPLHSSSNAGLSVNHEAAYMYMYIFRLVPNLLHACYTVLKHLRSDSLVLVVNLVIYRSMRRCRRHT